MILSINSNLRYFLATALLLSLTFSYGQKSRHNIIPNPVNYEAGKGYFKVTASTMIVISPNSKELSKIADLLNEKLRIERNTSNSNSKTTSQRHNTITLKLSASNELGNEGYKLMVDKKAITITANTGKGVFYGVQTLLQLLPAEIEEADPTGGPTKWKVPACSIVDYPRFEYRGMHLDVCRHLFPVDFIKKYIDLLATYKINNFHWHLTDDQGWRLEIKKYPLLTEIGSQRSSTPIGRNTRDDNTAYGGFYTQAEAIEIVDYAAKRYVNIIPEIEMPGHAVAALASYPALSCTGGPFEVLTKWGVSENIFCAGNENVYNFLEDVLSEVMDIFPSRYIHIGGDEAPKTRWEACPLCQQKIRDESLKDAQELQSYFIRRIEKFLNQNGRQIIGWDEILEGGLAPGATVMSWRGTEGGITAARMGHDVIMTPGTPCYFDHYQGPPAAEPLAIGGYNPLISVYNFEPIPPELDSIEASHILGSQGNLWTEYIPTSEQLEYMAFPRALALAEVNWSSRENRNWGDFSTRLNHHFDRLRKRNVNFSESSYNVDISTVYDSSSNEWLVKLSTDIPDARIRYSAESKENSDLNEKYHQPFLLTETANIKAELEINGERSGKTSERTVYIHDGFGKMPLLNTQYNYRYSAKGPSTLTDGQRASPLALHADWLGFLGNDADLVIDLGKEIEIRNINIGYLFNPANWIFLPTETTITLSTDGINYTPAEGMRPDLLTMREPVTINYTQVQINTVARYIRIVAKNRGICPQDHPGNGNKAWLFLDEVLINIPEI